VARFANDAVKISKLAGQEKRVLEALKYLSAFPAEFAGRAEILVALDTAHPLLKGITDRNLVFGARPVLSGRRERFPLTPPSEPCVKVSLHTAQA
jgi:hypothetical protein